MNDQTSKQTVIAANGMRWANNILVEISSNYGAHIPERAREHLRKCIEELSNAMYAMRFDEAVPPSKSKKPRK